jgi:histone H3/H4
MKEAVDRVMKAFAQKHNAMTPDQERRVRDEVSDFIAELLEKRATQLTKFSGVRSGAAEPRI